MEEDVKKLIDLAAEAIERGDFNEAVCCYQEYLMRHPLDFNALLKLGQVYYQAEKLDEAEKCFRFLNTLIPGHCASLWLLARTLAKKGMFDEAAVLYKQIAQCMPHNATIAFELGTVYANQGRYNKAISQFKQALELRPDFTQAEQSLCHLQTVNTYVDNQLANAFLLLQTGQYEKAEQIYRIILAANPINALACYFMGDYEEEADALTFAHALRHYWQGQLRQADLLCRQALTKNAQSGWPYAILAMIAGRLGRTDLIIEYFGQAIASSLRLSQKQEPGEKVRFLLIKAWGSGFWSDFEHVLGQLFWAEVLGRKPIVYWGSESLYSNGGEEDIFTKFFEPVSEYTIDDVAKAGFRYYPAVWRHDNLTQFDRHSKLIRYREEAWGIDFFGRSEEVIVSDIHVFIDVLLPWIPREHRLFGITATEAYRYILKKYIKLQPDIVARINRFYEQNMNGHNFIAVHARGGDRTESVQKLQQNNEEYFKVIDAICSQNPALHLFLLTDSQYILNEFKQKYGDRLLFTECTRTTGPVGVHYLPREESNKQELAVETIIDVYLAARCDYFIGCNSNVSTMIKRLKTWEEDKIVIFDHLPSAKL